MSIPSSVFPTYSFRPRLVGGEFTFRLTDDAIEWEAGSRKKRIPFRQISHLRLSYRPGNVAFRRFLTEIWSRENGKLSIASVSAQGPFNYEDRGEDYSSFVVELVRRLGEAQPGFRFDAGMSAWRWWFAMAFATATLAAVLYVVLQGFKQQGNNLAILMIVFGALFVWQMGTMLLRNRPRSCEGEVVPQAVLP